MRQATVLLVVAGLLASCERAPATKAKSAGQPATAPTTELPPTEPPKPPPPLTIATWLNTEPLTLEGLKGKVIVLDFWAIFCGPCRRLAPHLNQLYEKHKAEGLVVIGVTEDLKADVEKFAQDRKLTYPLAIDTLVDGDGRSHTTYGIVAIPTAYLIGRDGNVAWKGPGEQLSDEMVLAELAKK